MEPSVVVLYNLYLEEIDCLGNNRHNDGGDIYIQGPDDGGDIDLPGPDNGGDIYIEGPDDGSEVDIQGPDNGGNINLQGINPLRPAP